MRLHLARLLLVGAIVLLAGCAGGTERFEILRPVSGGSWSSRSYYNSVFYDAGKFSIDVYGATLYADQGKGAFFVEAYLTPQFSVVFKSLTARLIVDPRKAVFAAPCGPGARYDSHGAVDFSLAPQQAVVAGEPDFVLPDFPAVLEPGQDLTVIVKLKANGMRIARCSLDLSRAILSPEKDAPPALPFVRESEITPAP